MFKKCNTYLVALFASFLAFLSTALAAWPVHSNAFVQGTADPSSNPAEKLRKKSYKGCFIVNQRKNK
jgi:hypothetical protein